MELTRWCGPGAVVFLFTNAERAFSAAAGFRVDWAASQGVPREYPGFVPLAHQPTPCETLRATAAEHRLSIGEAGGRQSRLTPARWLGMRRTKLVGGREGHLGGATSAFGRFVTLSVSPPRYNGVLTSSFLQTSKRQRGATKIFFKYVIAFMCNLSDLIVCNRVAMDVATMYTKLSKSLINEGNLTRSLNELDCVPWYNTMYVRTSYTFALAVAIDSSGSSLQQRTAVHRSVRGEPTGSRRERPHHAAAAAATETAAAAKKKQSSHAHSSL